MRNRLVSGLFYKSVISIINTNFQLFSCYKRVKGIKGTFKLSDIFTQGEGNVELKCINTIFI